MKIDFPLAALGLQAVLQFGTPCLLDDRANVLKLIQAVNDAEAQLILPLPDEPLDLSDLHAKAGAG